MQDLDSGMDVVLGGRHIGDTNGRRRGYCRLDLHDPNRTAMSRRLVEHGFLVPLGNDQQVVEVILGCVFLKKDNGLVEGIQLRLGSRICDPLRVLQIPPHERVAERRSRHVCSW